VTVETRLALEPDQESGHAAVELLLETVRSLLWANTREAAREAATRFVTGVGGHLVSANSADVDTMQVDLSFGSGSPVLPSAALGSATRMLLERHLPQLVLDINRAVAVGSETKRLLEDASIDPLTKLPNRRQVGRGLGRLRSGDVVILVDLDHFKQVNDSWGHAAGDATLRAFGDTMASTLRNRDVVGRYGGEEFVIILGGGDPEAFLTRLRGRWTENRPYDVTFTAGIAVFSHAAKSSLAVSVAADRAMYRAKRAGRDQWLWATASEYVA
jgi:diguanylate cyclase (GGDEF)-like protein